MKGSAASHGSRVRYYNGATDITKEMLSRTGWSNDLPPALDPDCSSLEITCYVQVGVRITVGPNARLGTRKAATVTGRDGSRTDLVKARVRVVS
jgi:hypothetical protein